jgi:hypothetical protein
MQENQGTQQSTHSQQVSETVGFPPQLQEAPKKGFPKLLLIGILGLILIGGGAFFLLHGGNEEVMSPSPSPQLSEVQGISTSPTLVHTIPPTPTPQTSNKAELSIQILNGTGIPGEAGYLETQLKSLGYTKTQTGNASGPTVTTTTVIFSPSVQADVVDEIKTKLQSIYKLVESQTSSSTSGNDVKITVGLRKGATPKPATSAASTTPRPSVSPTASPSSTPST